MTERAIVRCLRGHKKFLVTMHVNPDPDALGAALAMALFLRALGKKVRVINDGACPGWLRFMPQARLYETFDADMSFDPEVVVVLDSGDIARVGRVAQFIRPGVKVVNIDHHVTNNDFGDYNLVRTELSSTSENLYGLLTTAGARMTRDMATLLYLGILTDTGSFGFDCTSSHTHQVIAELLKFKLPVSDLYRQVYETMPEKDLKIFLSLINTLTLHHGGQVACLTLSRRQAARFSDEFDLKDKVFTFLRAVKGIEVIVILTQQGAQKTRLNLRSRGAVDVARFVLPFGGGGHRKASGGSVDMPLRRSKAFILEKFKKILPRRGKGA